MRTISLGISGSISAYRATGVTNQLTKFGYNVETLVTKNDAAFIILLTLQSLSKNPVHTNIMMEIDPSKISHIELAKKADLFLVAPVSTNTIGKLAHGIADDLLSAVTLALYPETPKIIAPVANTYMYRNPIVQRNIGTLREVGYQRVIPRETLSACGDYGRGTLATAKDIPQTVVKVLASDSKE